MKGLVKGARTARTRAVAWLSVFAMLISCFVPLTALAEITSPTLQAYTTAGLAADSDGNSETPNTATVKTGEPIVIRATAGFADTDTANYSVKLYIGDMKYETLTYFQQGGEVDESRTVDGITYTIKQDEIGRYIDITGFTGSGATFVAPIQAYFDPSAPNGTKWDLKLVITNENESTEHSITLIASSTAEMKTAKTVSPSAMTLSTRNDATTLSQDITYTISAYSGDTVDTTWTDLENGEAAITEYTVTDTLTLPDGMSFHDTSNWPNVFDMSFTPTNVTFNENTATITYTVTSDSTDKQIRDFTGTVKLKKEAVTVAGDTANTAKDITNSAQTSYKVKNGTGAEKFTEKVEVKTTVQRPSDGNVADFGKWVETVKGNYASSSSSNMYKDDIVVFKLTYRNSGESPLGAQTITDTLPEGLTLLTAEQATAAGLAAPVYGDSGSNVNYTQDGQALTITTAEVAAGAWYNVYVAAKVTGNEERTLTNSAELNGVKAEASVYQKVKAPKLSISKNAVKLDSNNNDVGNTGVYTDGETVKFYITVSNNGAEDASDVKLTDYFPYKQMEVLTADVSSKTDGVVCDGINADSEASVTGEMPYRATIATLPAGGRVTFAITAKDVQTNDVNVTNNAVAVFGDQTVEASCTLSPYSEVTTEAQVAVKKQLLSSSNVKVGDIVTYSIVLSGIPAGKYVYSYGGAAVGNAETLYIQDMLPDWLTFSGNSITVTRNAAWSDNENVPKVETEQQGQLITFKYQGNSCGGTITIQYECIVNEKAALAENQQFSNSATVVGGTTGTAETITTAEEEELPTVSDTGLKVSKQAFITRDGVEKNVETDLNGTIKPGEEITFKLIVENTNTTEAGDVTELTLTEEMLGNYNQPGDPYYGISISVVADECENVEFTKEYDGSIKSSSNYTGTAIIWLDSNTDYYSSGYEGTQRVFSQIKPIDIKVTNQSSSDPTVYSNTGFKLKHGGKLVLEYSITPASTFTLGSNSVSVDGSAPARVDYHLLSGLSIDKYSSVTGGTDATDWSDHTDYIWNDDNAINNGKIHYKITIANRTTVPYTSNVLGAENGTYFIDELPEGTVLTGPGKVYLAGEELTNVKFYGGNSYTDTNWTEITEDNNTAYNSIGIFLGDQITIGGWQYLDIYYDIKLSDEEKDKLKAEMMSNGDGTFASRTYVNDVYFYGDNAFEECNGDTATGNITNTITDFNTAVVKSKPIHPGLEKDAYAFFGASSNKMSEGDDVNAVDLAPGAYLIWKLTVKNGGTAKTGKAMSNFTVTDTLPEGYVYAASKSNSTVSYPDSLKDNELRTGKIVKVSGNNRTAIGKLEPTRSEDGRTVTWTFRDAKYTLQPGEYLEFTLLTIPEDESNTESGLYFNEARLTVNGKVYEDSVSAGLYEDDKTVTDNASFALNSVASTSKKEVVGTVGSDGTVQYKLTIKNESIAGDMEDLYIIDKLPYADDTGVLTEQKRGSQCDAEFVSVDSITVGGAVRDVVGNVSYSGVSDVVFEPTSPDWDGVDGLVDWTTTASSSAKLVRINIGKLEKGQTAEVLLTAKITPEETLKTNTVYNTFGYCYNGGNAINMAAEAPKVGATYTAPVQSGSIRVKKVYADYTGLEKTFWFTVYDGEYDKGGAMVGSPQSITLQGDTLGRPVNAETVFTDIPYPDIVGASRRYYIYETDEQGVPIAQSSSLGYTMYTGFYRLDKESPIEKIADGAYCYLDKGLSLNQRENSAIFSNLNLPEDGSAEVTHVFYADVPTDDSTANYSADMVSGYKVYENGELQGTGVIKDDKTDTNDVDYEYASGGDNLVKQTAETGWGGNQGHTVATGFLATITGGSVPTPFNMINWNISTLNNGSYMRLTEAEANTLTPNGITITKEFADGAGGTAVYKVTNKNPKTISVQDPMPKITLGAKGTAVIGLILDGIYDQNATATIDLDAQYDQEQVNGMLIAAGDASDAEYIKVESPIQTGGFNSAQGAIAVLTTKDSRSWKDLETAFSNSITEFNGALTSSVKSNDGHMAIYASDDGPVTVGTDDTGSYIRVGSVKNAGTSEMAGGIALNLVKGSTIKIKAASGSATQRRGLVVLDNTGKNLCITSNDGSFGTPTSLGLTDYAGNAGRPAFWMDSTPREYTATVTTGGMACIASVSSNIFIYSIEVIPPTAE